MIVWIYCVKLVRFLRGAVVNLNLEAVVGDVESEVLTHDGKADESDIRLGFRHSRTNSWPEIPAKNHQISLRCAPPEICYCDPAIVVCQQLRKAGCSL